MHSFEYKAKLTTPPQESAAASTDHTEQESSLITELAPGFSQTSVHLQISSGDVAQDDDIVGQLIAPDGTEWNQLTLGEHSSGRFSHQNILRESYGLCIMQNEVYVLEVQQAPLYCPPHQKLRSNRS